MLCGTTRLHKAVKVLTFCYAKVQGGRQHVTFIDIDIDYDYVYN